MCPTQCPKVLVVDDEEIIRSLFRKTFNGMNLEFSEASDGAKALEMVSTQEYDLIITDIRMPDIDGVDLLRKVKQKTPLTEVIVITGYANENAAIEAVRLGAYDFIKKPFESAQKVARVAQNALEKQQLERQNRDLVADLRRKVFELQVLYDLSDKLTEVSGFSQMAFLILDSLDKLAPYKTAAIVLFGKDEIAGVLQATRTLSEEEMASIKAALNEKLHDLTNSTLDLENLHLEVRVSEKAHESVPPLDPDNGIVIPLNKSKDVIGFLWILGETDDNFGPDDKTTLELLSERLTKNTSRLCEERMRQESAKQVLLSANRLLDAQNDELKKMNRELASANKELEEANREIKTAHAKLLQQEKMASIGMLAAGVAHEINNPIGYIHSNMGTLVKYVDKVSQMFKAYEEVLDEIPVSDEHCRAAREELKRKAEELRIHYVIEDLANLARESSEGTIRVKKIVADLKNFSHADDNKETEADINELLETTLNIVWNELKYKTEVVKNYGNLPLIRCYPMQLNQVFMNLLINAAQAIEEQGKVTITTKVDGENVTVTIADNGSGISEENIKKIFDPFFTTKPLGKGTGLGLSVVYDIIQRHRGKIDIKSEVGVGTEFTLSIPIARNGDV